MNIYNAKKVLMVGIAGSGMRGLAYLLTETGKQVIGTDSDSDGITSMPQKEKYTLVDERAAVEAVKNADVLILTDAVSKRHSVFKAAIKEGIEIVFYQEALAQLVNRYKVIAVAGTHGKTSTSALISHIMLGEGFDPSVLLGAGIKEWGNKSSRIGRGKYFIVEADEYRNHFFQLKPDIAVITSIDYDHADFFSSLDDVRASFSKFMDNVAADGRVVVGRNTHDEHKTVSWHKNTVIVEESSQDAMTNIYGEHMRRNAVLAMRVGEAVGIPTASILEHINNFGGVNRRMEELGSYKGMPIISDYGHHPTEIVATLKSFREKYIDKRVLVIFEAHTLKRLTTFKDNFAKALLAADGVLLAPVFVPAGREREERDAKQFVKLFGRELKKSNMSVGKLSNWQALRDALDDVSEEFDVVLAFTAGVADRYLREIVDKRNL